MSRLCVCVCRVANSVMWCSEEYHILCVSCLDVGSMTMPDTCLLRSCQGIATRTDARAIRGTYRGVFVEQVWAFEACVCGCGAVEVVEDCVGWRSGGEAFVCEGWG